MKKEITRFGLFALVGSLAVMTGCGYNNNNNNSKSTKDQKQQMRSSDSDDNMRQNNGRYQNGCS